MQFHGISQSWKFEVFIMLVVVVNTLFMALEHYNQGYDAFLIATSGPGQNKLFNYFYDIMLYYLSILSAYFSLKTFDCPWSR